MAMNLDAVLRIKAVVGGVADVNALTQGLKDVAQSAQGATKELKAAREQGNWRESAAKITATAAAFAFASKSAIDFESSVADVRKVVDGIDTPAGLIDIKKEILGLTREMPITAEGFAEIYAAAGQSGIAREELRDFAVLVGKVSTAFDMTAQEAGTALSQIKVGLGLGIKEVEALADSMNFLSNNTGTTAANLVEFMTRAGAVGKLAGLSGQETAAFGAAMMETGVQSEVAATSFNNLIKALSAGAAMTERQVGALERLGYAYRPAVVATRDYTTEAEAQSRQRLTAAREEADERVAIARNETDRLTREIDDRYRQIKQQLQDQWEDERDAREEAIGEAGRRAGKALQREQQRELQQLNDQYDERLKAELARFKGRTDDLANAEQEGIRKRYRDARQQEIQAIDDRYEAQRQQLDKQNQQTLKAERRAARDRENLVVERLENEQRVESDGARKQLDQIENTESRRIEALTEAEKVKLDIIRQQQKQLDEVQKRQAEQAADAWKLGFSERLQREGSGFIMEILKNISKLPAAEQSSVMRDLFGDEARGLAPMIANVERLAEVLGVATNATGAAGSVNKEYGVRAQTTANQLALLNNSVNELKVAFGEALLPILKEVTAFSIPLIRAFADIVSNVNKFITAIIKITGIGAILGPATGPLVSFAVLLSSVFSFATLTRWTAGLKILAFLPGPLRLVAAAFGVLTVSASPLGPLLNVIYVGLLAIQALKFGKSILAGIGAIKVAFSGFFVFLVKTAAPAILAFFSGPAGWTVLAVAAVVAMAIAFRKPIADFLLWLGPALVKGIASFLNWLGSALAKGFAAAWELVKEPVTAFWEWLKGVTKWSIEALLAIGYAVMVLPWQLLWQKVLREPVTQMWEWLKGVVTTAWKRFISLSYALFVQPWIDLWNNVLREPVTAAAGWLGDKWSELARWFNVYLAQPIRNAWQTVINFIPNAMEAVANKVQNIWNAIINTVRQAIGGMLSFITTAINAGINNVNRLIRANNSVSPFKVQQIQQVPIPQFAAGGYVTRPTIAQIGEGGEPEYVVPRSKALGFANNIVAGRAGAQAIPAGRGGGFAVQPAASPATTSMSAGPPIAINITTGPVVEMNGQTYVSYDDLERAMRVTADGVVGRLRTPYARQALGGR